MYVPNGAFFTNKEFEFEFILSKFEWGSELFLRKLWDWAAMEFFF